MAPNKGKSSGVLLQPRIRSQTAYTPTKMKPQRLYSQPKGKWFSRGRMPKQAESCRACIHEQRHKSKGILFLGSYTFSLIMVTLFPLLCLLFLFVLDEQLRDIILSCSPSCHLLLYLIRNPHFPLEHI